VSFTAAMKTVFAKTVTNQSLAEELASSGIDVIAFNPGLVKSGLRRDLRFPMKHLLALAQVFMAQDSATGIYAATSEELNGVTGHYVASPKQRDPLVFDRSYREDLLRRTDALVERALA